MDIFAKFKRIADPVVLDSIACETSYHDPYLIHNYSRKKKCNDLPLLPRPCYFLLWKKSAHEVELIDVIEEPVTDIETVPQVVYEWEKSGDLDLAVSMKTNGTCALVKLVLHRGRFLLFCSTTTVRLVTTIERIQEEIQTHEKNTTVCMLLHDIQLHYEKLVRVVEYLAVDHQFSYALNESSSEYTAPTMFVELCNDSIYWLGLFKKEKPMETVSALTLLRQYGLPTVEFQRVIPPKAIHTAIRIGQSSTYGSMLWCRNVRSGETVLVLITSMAYRIKRMFRECLINGYIHMNGIQKRMIESLSTSVPQPTSTSVPQPTSTSVPQPTSTSVPQPTSTSVPHPHPTLGRLYPLSPLRLSTQAAVRITHQLYGFCFWMMKNLYPVTVLHTDYDVYWNEYVKEGRKDDESTGDQDERKDDKADKPENKDDDKNDLDIVITSADMGPFDRDAYLERSEPYQKRKSTDPVLVVFLQGIQGSGKSSIGNACCERVQDAIYLEQDMYDGDTNSCQGALYHLINNTNGPKTIFLTRCNINPKQYKRYLDLCRSLPTRVTFFRPELVNPLYLVVSLAGIWERSESEAKGSEATEKEAAEKEAAEKDATAKGNKEASAKGKGREAKRKATVLQLGPSWLPVDRTIEIVIATYNDYDGYPTNQVYRTVRSDPAWEEKIASINFGSTRAISTFVKKHQTELLALRRPLNEIATDIVDYLVDYSRLDIV